MSRLRFIAGSLVGAVLIHVAFIACSTVVTDRDSGRDAAVADAGVDALMDAAEDALADIIEAEQPRDARADDAGTCTCPPPARESYTFSGTITRNGVAQQILRNYSTLTVDEQHQLNGTQEQVRWSLDAKWQFGSGVAGEATCAFLADRTTGLLIGTNRCSLQFSSSPGGPGIASVTVPMTTSFSQLTDTSATLNLPSMTAGEFVAPDFVFHLSQPQGGLVEPPKAYVP